MMRHRGQVRGWLVAAILGQADPQDPLPTVADAPREMRNSLTVVVPGEAHTVGHLGCMPDMVAAFIAAGMTNGLDTSCASTGMTPPAFRTSP
ncbi:MAG TPA: alpha/beta hydrolase [Candidatus Limnocylindrales bacterium]